MILLDDFDVTCEAHLSEVTQAQSRGFTTEDNFLELSTLKGFRASGTEGGHPCLMYCSTLLKIESTLVAFSICTAVTGNHSI